MKQINESNVDIKDYNEENTDHCYWCDTEEDM